MAYHFVFFGNFNCYWFWYRTLLWAFKKNPFTMKIERVTCFWMFVYAINFWAARNGKKLYFRLFRPKLRELGLFHAYFVCKCSFREISMIKMVILDQSKPISLYSKFVYCTFMIHKNGNKKSIQPILKLNSTSFSFNNIFCDEY